MLSALFLRRMFSLHLPFQIKFTTPFVTGHSQLEAMTKRWFVEDHANQPHLWEEDTTVFDWLKSQLDPETGPSSVSQVPPGVRMLLI
jgi:hypothetical protein